MSAASPHGGGGNGHSATIQIDPPAQTAAPSATDTPFPLPVHRPNYNDDDEDSDEDDPLLGASTTTRGGPGPRHHQLVDQDDDETGQRGRSSEPAPFLYRLHDWLADRGTKLKSVWSSSRSAKVSLAGWRKVLKWVLIFLGVFLALGLLGLLGWFLFESVTVCRVKDSESVQMQYSFHPEQYKKFFFHLDRDIVGDITVSQYSSQYEGDGGDEVMIYVNARGSSRDMVRAVNLGTISNPDDSSLEAYVYLSMLDYVRDMLLPRGCVNTNVHIVFPQNMTHFDSLKVHNRNRGDVNINLGSRVFVGDGPYPQDPGQPTPAEPKVVIDRLDVKTNYGQVSFSNAFVKEDLKVVAAQGSIVGQITVDKRVEVESKKVALLTVFSNSTDLDLKVSAESVAHIRLKSDFAGHVAVKTWTNLNRPGVFSSDNTFVRQTRTLQSLTGYFPYSNGTEPTTYLPRIEVNSDRATLDVHR